MKHKEREEIAEQLFKNRLISQRRLKNIPLDASWRSLTSRQRHYYRRRAEEHKNKTP